MELTHTQTAVMAGKSIFWHITVNFYCGLPGSKLLYYSNTGSPLTKTKQKLVHVYLMLGSKNEKLDDKMIKIHCLQNPMQFSTTWCI